MPKPTAAANATATPEAPRRLTDAEKLARIHDLEGAMYDAANAAGVVWDLLEDLFDGSRTTGIFPENRPDLHSIDPGRLDRFHYAVSEAWQKSEKLRDDLLAGLGYRI